MKILVLSDDFPPESPGGGGTVAYALTRELAKRGHDILVVTTVREPGKAGDFSEGGLRVKRIRSSYPLGLRAYVSLWNAPVLRRLKRIIAEFKPDVVHAHNIHAYLSYGALSLAKKSGARVILTCHDVMPFTYGKFTEYIDKRDLSIPKTLDYRIGPLRQLRAYRFKYNPFRNIVIRRILRKDVDHIVAVSQALKDAMEQNGIEGVRVIHNAIDVQEWEEPAEAVAPWKRERGLGDNVVLFGGRLSGVKGGYELIEALGTVSKNISDVQLLVIGEKNAYADKMGEISPRLGFDPAKIVFTGWLSGRDLHLAYHAAAIAASPSLCFDSFIMVNLEAMACGKPAVTTCFGGASEVVANGTTGYVVNPFDISSLAERVGELLLDKEKAERFGGAGYERATSTFSLERCAAAYESLFR